MAHKNHPNYFPKRPNTLNSLTNPTQSLKSLSNKRDSVVNERKLTADEQIERLLGQVWRNPYDVLQLDKEATDEEIRKAFKQLSLVVHPDKC